MASLEDSLIASAIEALNIEDYWPTFDSRGDIDQVDDGEYSIILYFYEELLNFLIERYSVRSEDLKAAIKHLVYNYGRVSNGKTPQDLDYDVLTNCLGYLHRYAACHTALVHTVMVKIFHTSPPAAIRRILALKDHLQLMCLGSGPGNDFVGFLSALYGKHYGLLKIDVTLVDKMEGWHAVFQETERRLRRGLCGNASKIFQDCCVRTRFVAADLKASSSWDSAMRSKMAEADVVLMAKVLSVVPSGEKLQVLKNVVSLLKPGSLLIFIDCPYPAAEFASLTKYLETVYEASKEKFEFDFQVERFGYTNITMSRAIIRVFVKKFVLGQVN